MCDDDSKSSAAGDMESTPGPSVAHAGDLALARAAAAQDAAALAALTQRLACVARFVHAANRSFGGALRREDLEDATQEALGTIWRRLGDFRGEASLETWAFRIADFSVRNATRRLLIRRSVSVDSVAEPAVEGESGRLAEVDALEAALAKLAPEDAVVLRLKHYEDLTFEQVGKTLELSPNTIKTRYYRALATLRNTLCPPFES